MTIGPTISGSYEDAQSVASSLGIPIESGDWSAYNNLVVGGAPYPLVFFRVAGKYNVFGQDEITSSVQSEEEEGQVADTTANNTVQGNEEDGGFDLGSMFGDLNVPDWVSGSTWIEGIPNWALLAAGGIGLFLVLGRR